MGYRSNGKLYVTQKVFDLIPEELKLDLAENWDKESTDDEYMIFSFEYWKWYDSYEDVKSWNNFLNSLAWAPGIEEDDWDFIVVGEDNAIIDHRTETHFCISMTIETM